MKIRSSVLGFLAVLGLASIAVPDAAGGCQTAPAKPGGSVESRLPGYLVNFLSYDPASKVTVEKTNGNIPGFQTYKIKRTGKYPKLAVDRQRPRQRRRKDRSSTGTR